MFVSLGSEKLGVPLDMMIISYPSRVICIMGSTYISVDCMQVLK